MKKYKSKLSESDNQRKIKEIFKDIYFSGNNVDMIAELLFSSIAIATNELAKIGDLDDREGYLYMLGNSFRNAMKKYKM